MESIDDVYCIVTNPETGDRIVIEQGLDQRSCVYLINDGPEAPIPARFGQQSYMYIAKLLLWEHIRACAPCDNEELTLP